MKNPKNNSITLRGIERNTNDINVVDGACDEIINMRYKDGSWRPVGSKSLADLHLPNLSSSSIIYHHPVTDENIVYCVQIMTDQFVILVEQDGASYTETTLLTLNYSEEQIQTITSLNNILIVVTNINRYFLLWDYDNEVYTELEEIPMPLVCFEKNIVEEGSWLGTELFEHQHLVDATNGSEFAASVATCAKELEDAYIALRAKYAEDGLVSGYVLLRFAFKLYDGTYIKHSMPFFVALTDNNLQLLASAFDGGIDWKYCYRWNLWYGAFGNLKYIYNFTLSQKNILEKYKGIIKSIDFFMTNPIIEYDFVEDIIKGTDDGGLDIEINGTYTGSNNSFYLEDNPYKQDIIKELNFYKIDSIDLQTILNDYAPTSLIDFDFSDIKNILTKETLPVDNFTHHQIWGQKHYNYNSRLHFGNITTKFFGGFCPFFWDYLSSNNSTYNYAIKTWIKTDKGDKIVTQYFDTPLTYSSPTTLLTNAILAYPDSRAYKMRFLQEDSGSPGDYYYDNGWEFNLIPHPFLNLAYNIDAGFDNEYGYSVGQSGWNKDSLEDMTENKLLLDTNRAQASKIDNALVYPTANSYQIGNDDETIIGFGSVVEPLSDGQFGQFPLYIFTTAGIFVLEQGSGEILYSNILPLNREVCNNALSITDIGRGVVYSTDKGLNILSGKNIIEISSIVKGTPSQYLVDNDTYQDYLNDPNFVELLSDVSEVDFLTYLTNSKIGYDYKNKEIIVSDNYYTYSYVYNLESKTWHKIKDVFQDIIRFIPEFYGYKQGDAQGELYDLKEEEDEYIESMIQTRPIKYDSLNRKSIDRLILRGYFDVNDLTYSGLYLFGTVDGKNYVFLRGKTPQDENTFQDILIKKTHANFKFLIVVFAGQLKDSSINFIETTFFERWNNKLR